MNISPNFSNQAWAVICLLIKKDPKWRVRGTCLRDGGVKIYLVTDEDRLFPRGWCSVSVDKYCFDTAEELVSFISTLKFQSRGRSVGFDLIADWVKRNS